MELEASEEAAVANKDYFAAQRFMEDALALHTQLNHVREDSKASRRFVNMRTGKYN